MDEDKDRRDPGVSTDFTTESSWPLDSNSAYFFTNNSTVFGEFGWSFNPDDAIVGADDDRSDLGGSSSTTPVDQNNSSSSSVLRSSVEPEPAAPVIGSANSTSSCEDRPEGSTGSGDKPPPETPT